MSEGKSRPAYPVKGFIISGDPTSAASVSGCSRLSVTEASSSGVVAPGSTSRHATSALKTKTTTPEGSRNPSLVQGGSSKPGTSKAHKVRMGSNPIKPHVSGAGKAVQIQSAAKPVSSVPENVQEEHTKKDSMPFKAPPSASTANTSVPQRHKNPSRRAFTTRRSAYRIVSRLGTRPAEELTEQESNSLHWAQTHIEGLKRISSPAEDGKPKRPPSAAAPKRQRSEEDTLPRTKRPKNAPERPQMRSYREVAKDHLIWAIIDRNNSDGTISPGNWKRVVLALSEAFLVFIREHPGPPPQCQDAGWYQGHVKLIACADERSALLYKSAIESLGEVWSGARLEAVPLADVPQRPRSIAKIPAKPSDPKEILEMLQISNPQLPTHDWKVVRVTDVVDGFRKATVVLNSDSLSPLRGTRGRVFYGFGDTFLRVYRGDEKQKPLTPEIAECTESCNDEATSSAASEDTQSVTGLVGDFFGRMEVAEDEDALLESDDDPEDANVTVVHREEL